MAQEPRLSLPYISSNQAQKEVTHNEAILKIGRLLQGMVIGIQGEDPQSLSPTPSEGDAYIVMGGSPAATGDFLGEENNIAYWTGTAWEFLTPIAGYIFFVRNARQYWAFDGSSWVIAISLP